MHRLLFEYLKKAGVCQPFFSSLFITSTHLIAIFLYFSSSSYVWANEDCDKLMEDENWQQTAIGLNGRDTWIGNNLTNYSFDLEESCYCPEQAVMRIKVCERSVFSVKNQETGELFKETATLMKYRTIMGYFDLIQELQSQHPDEIRVKLNRYLGYPEEVWINPSYKTGDDEINIRISNVVPLSHN